MTIRTSRQELILLRISMARVAQAAGVDLTPIGLPNDVDYAVLRMTANTRERGWNHLAADITEQLRLLGIVLRAEP